MLFVMLAYLTLNWSFSVILSYDLLEVSFKTIIWKPKALACPNFCIYSLTLSLTCSYTHSYPCPSKDAFVLSRLAKWFLFCKYFVKVRPNQLTVYGHHLHGILGLIPTFDQQINSESGPSSWLLMYMLSKLIFS